MSRYVTYVITSRNIEWHERKLMPKAKKKEKSMTYDVVIVGGSFAGLSAAMQLARARRNILLIDAGLPRNRFARSSHGFLGQDGAAPQEIVNEGRRQLSAYPSISIKSGMVASVRQQEGGFVLGLAEGPDVLASRLVLALGVSDTLPAISGLRERWGLTVLHCPYCHGFEVAGQPLGVIASVADALHQALMIPDWGPTTLFTQGIINASADDLAQLTRRGVTLEHSPVVELCGGAGGLEAVKLADGRSLPVSAVFVQPKTTISSPLASELGCALDDGPSGRFIRVDAIQATSIAHVFAAGDAASPRHNATFASAAGVMAGVAAHRSLMGF
jgi:thioredoxin reductase